MAFPISKNVIRPKQSTFNIAINFLNFNVAFIKKILALGHAEKSDLRSYFSTNQTFKNLT